MVNPGTAVTLHGAALGATITGGAAIMNSKIKQQTDTINTGSLIGAIGVSAIAILLGVLLIKPERKSAKKKK